MRLSLPCLAVAALLLGSVGCRSPKLAEGARVAVRDYPRPTRSGAPAGATDTATDTGEQPWTADPRGGDDTGPRVQLPPPKREKEWVPTTRPIPSGNEDDLEVVKERRWIPVYFAYDQSAVGAVERAKIEKLAEYLRRYPHYGVVVEGHCDERGSDEYNRALGERRALAVKEALAECGVVDARVRTLSYGEERPADSGSSESAYQKNRRAEFLVVRAK